MAKVGEVEGGWGMHPAEMPGLSEVCTRRKLDPASGENTYMPASRVRPLMVGEERNQGL